MFIGQPNQLRGVSEFTAAAENEFIFLPPVVQFMLQ
jgi:hypothetical protein